MKPWLLILTLAATSLLTGCAGVAKVSETPPGNGGGGGGGGGASQHSVDLSWAESSADVSGYNVYRAVYTDSCGSFSMINSGLVPSPRYSDSEVTNGASYCYATTALSTTNQETDYSNVVWDVRIPAS